MNGESKMVNAKGGAIQIRMNESTTKDRYNVNSKALSPSLSAANITKTFTGFMHYNY